MRIAIVLPGGVDRGGEDRVVPAVLWLIERLATRHDVHVFAMRQEVAPATWPLLGAHVHNVGSESGWRRRFFSSFAKAHREIRFDVIHALWASAGVYASMAGARHRIPAVLHLAGGELVSLPDIGYGGMLTSRGRIATRLACQLSARVTVASKPMLALCRAAGVDSDIVPLGVALDRWPPRMPRSRDTTHPARLLHIADLRPVKDQATLLAAAARLRDAGVDFQIDLAGLDTTNGEVQRLATALGIADRCRLHGVLRRDALRSLVDAADLLLVTSRHDAGPVAVLECAVAGVPTVGTAVGHIAEWAPDAAVSVDVGDAAALARETAALLADESRRLALAMEAQRRALSIDADYTAAQFERVYAEVRA